GGEETAPPGPRNDAGTKCCSLRRRRRTADPPRPRPPRPQRLAQLALADPNRIRRDLDQLVLVDPLEAILEAHGMVRDQSHRLVMPRRAHVAELLLAADVHVEIDVTRILAHHHPLVDRRPGGADAGAGLLAVAE